MSRQRVAVTGLGIVSAIGSSPDAVWAAIEREESGLGTLSLFESPRCGHMPVAEVKGGATASSVSARFHRTMAQIIARMCRIIAPTSKTSLVVLSGGVFQNRLLSRLATDALQKEGFQVITHRLVPCNDGGISLGQAIIAHFAAS